MQLFGRGFEAGSGQRLLFLRAKLSWRRRLHLRPGVMEWLAVYVERLSTLRYSFLPKNEKGDLVSSSRCRTLSWPRIECQPM